MKASTELRGIARRKYNTGLKNEARDLRRIADVVDSEHERLRRVVRDCARTLQHNLSMWSLKDERMMLRSLEAAWAEVGRSYCERPL